MGQFAAGEEIRAFRPPHPSHALSCAHKPQSPPMLRDVQMRVDRQGRTPLHTPTHTHHPTHLGLHRLQVCSCRHQCSDYRCEPIPSCPVKGGVVTLQSHGGRGKGVERAVSRWRGEGAAGRGAGRQHSTQAYKEGYTAEGGTGLKYSSKTTYA